MANGTVNHVLIDGFEQAGHTWLFTAYPDIQTHRVKRGEMACDYFCNGIAVERKSKADFFNCILPSNFQKKYMQAKRGIEIYGPDCYRYVVAAKRWDILNGQFWKTKPPREVLERNIDKLERLVGGIVWGIDESFAEMLVHSMFTDGISKEEARAYTMMLEPELTREAG